MREAHGVLVERYWNYEVNPGLALWLLNVLEQNGLLLNGVNYHVYDTAPRGEWPLEGMERLYFSREE